MAAESAEDLAALFHPDDFGVPMTAFAASVPLVPGALTVLNEGVLIAPETQAQGIQFTGILTTGHAAERPGSTADVSMMVPRIIARRAALPALAQNDKIELPSGQRVIVNDVHYKGELIIIHYHEHW